MFVDVLFICSPIRCSSSPDVWCRVRGSIVGFIFGSILGCVCVCMCVCVCSNKAKTNKAADVAGLRRAVKARNDVLLWNALDAWVQVMAGSNSDCDATEAEDAAAEEMQPPTALSRICALGACYGPWKGRFGHCTRGTASRLQKRLQEVSTTATGSDHLPFPRRRRMCTSS